MGTVPRIEGTVEGSDVVDPSKMSHDDIQYLATQYRRSVEIIAEQRRLLSDANDVIMRLQKLVQELQHDQRVNDLD